MILAPAPSYLAPGESVTPISGTVAALVMAPPGTMLLNQQIPNTRYGTPQQQPYDKPLHDNLIDIYEPPGTINLAMTMLHGGGASKGQYAASLTIISGPQTLDTVNWPALMQVGAAAWFIQGMHCTPANAGPWNPNGVDTVSAQYPNGIAGWSNRAYWSGNDDPQLLVDIAIAQSQRYSNVFKVLCGHSEGGMMMQRAWYEHAAGGFNCYCGSSSPVNSYYLGNPALPAVPKPMRTQFGLQDDNIGIAGGHFFDPTWVGGKNPTKSQAQTPVLSIGDFAQLQTRVNAYNTFHSRPAETVREGDGVTAPCAVGTVTTWTYCGGAMQMLVYSNATHSTKTQQACAHKRMFTDFAVFALQNINN